MFTTFISVIAKLQSQYENYRNSQQIGLTKLAKVSRGQIHSFIDQAKLTRQERQILYQQEQLQIQIVEAELGLEHLKSRYEGKVLDPHALESLQRWYQLLSFLHGELANSMQGQKASRQTKQLYIAWAQRAANYKSMLNKLEQQQVNSLFDLETEADQSAEGFKIYIEKQAKRVTYYQNSIDDLKQQLGHCNNSQSLIRIQQKLALSYRELGNIYRLSLYPEEIYRYYLECSVNIANNLQPFAENDNSELAGDEKLKTSHSYTVASKNNESVAGSTSRSTNGNKLLDPRKPQAMIYTKRHEKQFHQSHIERLLQKTHHYQTLLTNQKLSLLDQVYAWRDLAINAYELTQRYHSINQSESANKYDYLCDQALAEMSQAEMRLYVQLDEYNQLINVYRSELEAKRETYDVDEFQLLIKAKQQKLEDKRRQLFAERDVQSYHPVIKQMPHAAFNRLMQPNPKPVGTAIKIMRRAFRGWFNPQRFMQGAALLLTELSRGGVEQLAANLNEMLADPKTMKSFKNLWQLMFVSNSQAILLNQAIASRLENFDLSGENENAYMNLMKMNHILESTYRLNEYVPESIRAKQSIDELYQPKADVGIPSEKFEKYFQLALNDIETGKIDSKLFTLETESVTVKPVEYQDLMQDTQNAFTK